MKDKKTGHRKVIIWSIIGLLIVAIVILRFALPKKTNYSEVKPTLGNLATNYSFAGSIEAKNRQTVFADKTMQVKEIKVAEGQQVSTDTVLMTTVTGEEIKPSISGEISSIYAAENEQFMPGSKLIDIVDYSDLQLKVQVDEYDLSAVTKGKEATVTIHALNKDVSGKITDVSKEGEYTNGVTNFTAAISLPKDNNLRVGMSAEAKVLNQSVSHVVLLPMSAIQFDADSKPYVLVKTSNATPQTVPLTLGLNDGVHVEVKSGLTTKDTVLVPPAVQSSGFGAGAEMKQNTNPSTNQTTPESSGGGSEK